MLDVLSVVTTENQEWYKLLIEDCQDIITEAVFVSRWALVEGYHQLGERVITDNNLKRIEIYGKNILQDLAKSIGISERTLYYAIQFYNKYPELDIVPEGKNISWNKLITKYLPKPKENIIEIPLPTDSYNVIVIDPPWPYGTEYNSETRRVASPYKELSIGELSKLELPSASDCVLWLWTTHKFIWDAKRLVDMWGFEYKLTLVWDKEKLGMGNWLRCQVEFCLLGIKGNPQWYLTNERDLIREARQEHSRKPNAFYELIERLCEGKKLDMFGRGERAGWDIYGDRL